MKVANEARRSVTEDLHLVHNDGPSVRVRRYVVEDERGPHYFAELTAREEETTHSAVIDAPTYDELTDLIELAAGAFARAVRARARAARLPA